MIDPTPTHGHGQTEAAAWKTIVEPYQKPSTRRAVWQTVNTLGPLCVLWVLIYWSLTVSWWLVAPLAVLAGGLLVRVFIIFHDCGHGSFFKSRTANDVVGFIMGMLTFTPYFHWRTEHAIHHATAGHLDKRGTGDVWTMTVQEYLGSPWWKRVAYRLARNPVVLFLFVPLGLFLFEHRFASKRATKRERASVHWMNLAILGMAAGMSAIFGIKDYLILQVTMMAVAGSAGMWLFYVQHQFEGVYWAREDEWDFMTVAMQGSSFYKLPKILEWFSGNIGYHHIHHLSSRIPNYHLQRCHNAHPLFQTVKPVTLVSSLKSFRFRLWDEQGRQLVGYRHLRRMRQREKRAGRPLRRSGHGTTR
ncbi:MAG: fatty acid desaturase [Opitutales bacterium]|jgi:omega-6 fatty acid desaturase (delta-12 desaturase)